MGNVISEFGRLVLGVGRDIQCTVMPDYTSVDPGIIVQYTGATDANYINGYFYKCTSSGWVQENVQPETNISEKQDKILATPITVDGTSETTVEGALGGLKDYGHALADNLAANENVYGAKNQLDDDDCFSIDNMDKSGHTFTSNNTDTRGYLDFYIDAWDGTTFIQILVIETITSTGHYEYSINIPNNTNGIRVLHNGSQRNIGVFFNTSVTGACIISLDVTGVDPTTVGGLSFENIMIRDARILDPTFVPYAKTNLQLTQNKAERDDLSTIHATGSTNTTGAQIDAGTFFYLNGQFCKALTNIAVNATFTLNTNFEVATVGGELENKLNLVKVAESASGTDTYKNKLNALYSAFNGLSELEKINSFIASYGGGIAPMKLTFSYDKRFAYSSRQAANLLSELYITLDSSDSVLCEAILNSSTNEISINDQSSNNTSRTLYLYTLR